MAETSKESPGSALAVRPDDQLVPPLYPSRVLAGRRFVVVGGTGFLGKVWLSMLLHRFPELSHVYLMVRAKGDQSPEERFLAEILPSEVFEPLRERYPGAQFEQYIRDKVTPVGGDVGKDKLGLPPELVERLKGKIDAVINVAGVVDFNPPLDEALDVNAFGVNNLIDLARTLGAKVMHTSTCYVAGYRTGEILEVDPREVPFPRAEGASRGRFVAVPEDIHMDRNLERSHWDPQNEIRESMDVIEHVRHRCEDQFRQSLFLDEAKKNLKERGEPCRGKVLEDEFASVKRRFIKSRLIEAGMERALYWGWPNIYTYTKSIGEQVLAASGVDYTIVRPAVVESSNEYPFPGWNEGINTSAPFIYMALKGQVQFPADHDVHLDIIPVDMVCSGMIAALAELVEGTHKPVYQFGQTDTNPCSIARYMELIGLYKRKKWQDGGDEGNRIMNAILARVEPMPLDKKAYQTHGAHALASAQRAVASLFDAAGVGPAASLFRPAAKALRKSADREDKIGEIMDLFLPFVAECDWIFSCANTRHAMDRMPPEERERFIWAPEKIEWRDWMFDVHIPGIERWASPLFEERLRREVKPLRNYENLVDLLDEMAERHDHRVALRFLDDEGLTRTTFVEWREMSATVAARLSSLGVQKGDRVMLSGDNRPAWPITYFGILRAGAVAVPVDPKLSAVQLANVIESAGAKVAIFGDEVEGAEEARARVAGLSVLNLDDMESDDRTLEPPEVDIDGDDLASLIYTSGTTGDPKGVMLTHGNLTSLLGAISPLFALSPTDGVLSVLPLHHTFEFSCGLLLPMSRGACINYIGEITSERLGEGFEKARVSGMVAVPALWQMLERRLVNQVKDKGPLAAKAFDLSLELNRMLGKQLGINAGKLFFAPVHDRLGGRIKYLISGGSALPKSTADTFAGLGLKLSEGYGLTEAAPVLTVAKASPRSRVGNVGKAIPGVEIKIANPDKNGIGEVLARGPNVMQGYFGNTEATKAVIDDDGWLHTGDLGKLDGRGRLVLSGRSKEVIVAANGENVYPDDVEELIGHPKHVEELSVLGLERGDTEVVACIAVPELDDDVPREVSHERAMRSLKDAFSKLPRHCQPAIVQLYDAELPKTATRKVKRSEVRKILERLTVASRPPASEGDAGTKSDAFAAVQHAVAALSGKDASAIDENMSLIADLGFDSLMSMELQVAIEARIGRKLDPEQLTRVETVGDVVRLVGEKPVRKTAMIERDEDTAYDIPPPLAAMAKSLLTKAQMGFYDKMMKPTVYGRAFIPHNRNTIVVSNHASHLDMGFVKYALGSYGSSIVGLAAADYFFEGKIKRTYFDQLTNLQAFDRKTNLRQALREASETIESGKTVLIFPEGTRSKDGQIHEFKATAGHLALTTRTDILPIYLGGTYDSWPKGQRIPSKREIDAHIGPPLRIADLERLTEGLKLRAAAIAVAKLARMAVLALQRGTVLDLSQYETLEEALGEKREHPMVTLFKSLEKRFVPGKVKSPVTYYFTLGAEPEAKWTAKITPESCEFTNGKPDGNADCVLKTNQTIFKKLVEEAYMPTPVEVMSGQVKSNDVGLLATFQEAFDIR